jgi:hypothetical protein
MGIDIIHRQPILPASYLLPKIGCAVDPPTIQLGYDPARFGTAKNVLFAGHEDWVIYCLHWSGLDNYENAAMCGAVVEGFEDRGWVVEYLCIDVIGVGAGVVDILWHKQERYQYLVKPINVAFASTNPKRYRNVRSELGWRLRQRFREQKVRFYGVDKYGPNVGANSVDVKESLQRQATTIQYSSDERASGVVKLESKDDYKKRMEGRESPDFFDALALLFNRAPHAGVEKRPRARGRMIGSLAR